MSLESSNLYSFPPEKLNKTAESTVFIVDHPGSLAALGPVIGDFHTNEIPVFLQLAGIAEENLTKNLSLTQVEEITNCSTIVVSAGINHELVVQIVTLKEKFPSAKIIVVEDSPRSTIMLVEQLMAVGLKPNLWMVPTRQQALLYQLNFPQLAESTPIIPLGMPGKDSLLEQVRAKQVDMKKQRVETREKLAIPVNSFVVMFAGLPSGDIPNVSASETLSDLNSVTLRKVLLSLTALAQQNPNKDIYFIYKPHPRERENLWLHPHLLGVLPPNLRIRQYSQAEWKNLQEQGINTSAVSGAANVQLSPSSTVNHETAISNALNSDDNFVQPFYTLFEEVQNAFPADTLSMLVTPLTPAVYSPEELTKVLETWLLSPTTNQLFQKVCEEMTGESNRNKAATEYRLKGKAGPRVRLWLRAINRWGYKNLMPRLDSNQD